MNVLTVFGKADCAVLIGVVSLLLSFVLSLFWLCRRGRGK